MSNIFISHMVQIIHDGLGDKAIEIICLYIPHGSDNTREGIVLPDGRVWNFISHMVQIIPVNFGTTDTGLATLYPTWFR